MSTTTFPTRRSRLSAMLFHFQFDDLRRAYLTSMTSYDMAEKGAEETVRKMYNFEPGQPFPDVEYDPETGDATMDWGELIGEFEHEAVSSRTLVRTAFVIALFHFWERETNVWQNVVGQTYRHNATVQWITAQGGTPQSNRLRELELAANCAKHGPGRSCRDLYPLRPDLYGHTSFSSTYSPTHSDLVFTDQTVESFFDAVKYSGPSLGNPYV